MKKKSYAEMKTPEQGCYCLWEEIRSQFHVFPADRNSNNRQKIFPQGFRINFWCFLSISKILEALFCYLGLAGSLGRGKRGFNLGSVIREYFPRSGAGLIWGEMGSLAKKVFFVVSVGKIGLNLFLSKSLMLALGFFFNFLS